MPASNAPEILERIAAWDEAESEARLLYAQRVDETLGDFRLLGLRFFAAGGVVHEIAVFRHDALGLEFSLVPGGEFVMGMGRSEVTHLGPEQDEHRVALSPFLICRTEVPQGVWADLTGSDPVEAEDVARANRHHPAVLVAWDQARAFCRRFGLDLPTEAQWEYACRAGTTTRYSIGDDPLSLVGYANIRSYMSVATDEADLEFPDGVEELGVAGALKPNAFGLHDMHGNAAEWCRDTYGGRFAPVPMEDFRLPGGRDPLVSEKELPGFPDRVLRGGDYSSRAAEALCGARGGIAWNSCEWSIGFRPVKELR